MTFDRRGRGPTMLGLMGIVLAAALGFGAIASPSVLGGQAVITATLATLLVATAGAILCTPKAFWAGFAVVGWASLLVSSQLWLDDSTEGYLVPIGAWSTLDSYGFYRTVRHFSLGPSAFRQAVYPLVSIAQGVLGGLIAVGIARGRVAGTSAAIGVIVLALGATSSSALLWSCVVIQGVYVALFAFALGAVIGERQTFCRAAALAGFSAIILILHTLPQVGRTLAGWLFQQLDAIFASTAILPGYLRFYSHLLARVLEHLAALMAAILAGVIASAIARRRRGNGSS